MVTDLLITLFLVFLNGFFVAAEFALVKVRSSQLEILESEGNKMAALALQIQRNLDSYLSACQLGITLASLALGWIGESVVAQMLAKAFHHFNIQMSEAELHWISITLGFTLITILHIVLGEQAPKSFAIQNANKVSMGVAWPLKIFYTVFRPLIWFINSLSLWTLKLLGFKHLPEHNLHTAEELEILIDQGKSSGAIEPSEHMIIKNVFGFHETTCRQVMTPRTRIHSVDVEDDLEAVSHKVVIEGYSRMPVYEGSLDNIIGILYAKDLLRQLHQGHVDTLREVMRPAYFVPETKHINELLKELQAKHMHMAVITDEFGGISGVVTIEDIIEEIVGEIQDEHDEEVAIVDAVGENIFLINAVSGVEDVNEFLPEPLPVSAQYETPAGLMGMLLGKIPVVGDKIEVDQFDLEVTKTVRNRTIQIRLTFHPERAVEK
jgi:CBS domain containing-hemolysin-like protein